MSKVIGKSITPHPPEGYLFSPHLSELHIMNQQPISMEYSGLLFGPVQADISVVEIFIIPTMAFAYRVHIFSPKALVKFSGADIYSNQITETGDRHTLGGEIAPCMPITRLPMLPSNHMHLGYELPYLEL